MLHYFFRTFSQLFEVNVSCFVVDVSCFNYHALHRNYQVLLIRRDLLCFEKIFCFCILIRSINDIHMRTDSRRALLAIVRLRCFQVDVFSLPRVLCDCMLQPKRSTQNKHT